MMRRIIVLVSLLCLLAGAVNAQTGSAAAPTLKVSDGTKSFNGVNELRVPAGCVTFSGRTAIINCTAGTSSGTTNSQNGNLFYASPDGSYGLPSWRAIVVADLPSLSAAKINSGIFATARLGSGSASSSTYLRGDQTWAALPGDAVTSVFGRAGTVVAAANDYTWAQVNKATSSLADLTTRSASDLSSGTLPDARFPATLPALSGANLTALNATNLTTGMVPTARLGSGTASSSTYLRGDQTWATLPSSVGGSGTIGKIPKFTAGSTLGDSILIESGTSIGVGVTPNTAYSLTLPSHMLLGTTRQMSLVVDYAGFSEIPAGAFFGTIGVNGYTFGAGTNSASANAGAKVVGIYSNGTTFLSAIEWTNVTSGNATVSLVKSGGAVEVGGTLKVGANGTAVALERLGTCTLVAGTCTVADANVTTSSKIFLAAQDNNTIGVPRISARTASTSFTITSSNAADTGVVAWHLIN